MTIVRNKLTDVEGVGAPGFVLVRLVGPGLRPATQTEIIAQQTGQTAADGSWELDLAPNTVEAPYYVVAEQATDYRTVQHVVVVPDSDTPVWLGDITVQVPLPVGRADAVYAGPPGPPGPPGPSGLGAVDSVNGVGPVAGDVPLTADNIPDGATMGVVDLDERAKLGGVQAGATANQADSVLLDRANHTGTNEIADTAGLQEALNEKASVGDLNAVVSAQLAWTEVQYRYDNALRYLGTGTMPRPATGRPVHWHVPAAFSLPNTGSTAGGTTASVPGLDKVSRY